MLVTRHRTLIRTMLVAATAMLLSGCMTPKLVISSTTVIGLDATVNTARTAGHVQLGYDRYFVTWIPQTVPEIDHVDGVDIKGQEAMSSLNCTDVTVSGLTLTKFDESLATGRAARLFASRLIQDDKSIYFTCFPPAPSGGTK